MEIDALLVPTEVVAHEVYAQLSTPLLWRFLREMPAKGDDWAAAHRRPAHRAVRHAPAGAVEGAAHAAGGARARSVAGLGGGPARADCCATRRTATSRCTRRRCWCCAAARRRSRRTTTSSCSPGDELLLAGWPAARRALGHDPAGATASCEYVVTGRRVPSSWIWRRLSRTRAARGEPGRRPARGAASIRPTISAQAAGTRAGWSGRCRGSRRRPCRPRRRCRRRRAGRGRRRISSIASPASISGWRIQCCCLRRARPHMPGVRCGRSSDARRRRGRDLRMPWPASRA